MAGKIAIRSWPSARGTPPTAATAVTEVTPGTTSTRSSGQRRKRLPGARTPEHDAHEERRVALGDEGDRPPLDQVLADRGDRRFDVRPHVRGVLAHREREAKALLVGALASDRLDDLPRDGGPEVRAPGQREHVHRLDRGDGAQREQVRGSRSGPDPVERSENGLHDGTSAAAGFVADGSAELVLVDDESAGAVFVTAMTCTGFSAS